MEWLTSVALFARDITLAGFCMISQYQQVYPFATEYQRDSLLNLQTDIISQ